MMVTHLKKTDIVKNKVKTTMHRIDNFMKQFETVDVTQPLNFGNVCIELHFYVTDTSRYR